MVLEDMLHTFKTSIHHLFIIIKASKDHHKKIIYLTHYCNFQYLKMVNFSAQFIHEGQTA